MGNILGVYDCVCCPWVSFSVLCCYYSLLSCSQLRLSTGHRHPFGTLNKGRFCQESIPPDPILSLSLQDEQQQEMVASATFIDQHYGHLMDTVLVREDLQSACSQLRAVIEKLSKDTYWVPIGWVR